MIDLACVILDNWPLRQPGAEQGIREWHQTLLGLLLVEFGVTWADDLDLWEAKKSGLPLILPSLPQRYAHIQRPMQGIMEYHYQPGEEPLLHWMLPQIDKATSALQDLWRQLMCDMLLLQWPEAEKRSTTLARLRAAGLGKPPDRDDLVF